MTDEPTDALAWIARLPNTTDWDGIEASIQNGAWTVSGDFSGADIWSSLSAHEQLDAEWVCRSAMERMAQQLEEHLPPALFFGFFPAPTFRLYRNRDARPWVPLETNSQPQARAAFPTIGLGELSTSWPDLPIRAARLRLAHARMLDLLDGPEAPLWRAVRAGTGGFTLDSKLQVRAATYENAERMVLLVLLRIQILIQKTPNPRVLRLSGLQRDDGEGRRRTLDAELGELLR